MVDEQNDRDRDAVDALLDGLHAPVTPQPKPQPTPEPMPEHDYYFCWLSDCQRCADYADGYTDAALDAREWELGRTLAGLRLLSVRDCPRGDPLFRRGCSALHMDRKTPAGGTGGEGEDEQQTERPVSGCLGRAPRGPTRAGLANASAFASARDPSLRDLRVHTDGRARQALSASSHLLNRLLHRASGPSESRHRTRFSAPTSRTSQRDRRRRQGNRGRGWPR